MSGRSRVRDVSCPGCLVSGRSRVREVSCPGGLVSGIYVPLDKWVLGILRHNLVNELTNCRHRALISSRVASFYLQIFLYILKKMITYRPRHIIIAL